MTEKKIFLCILSLALMGIVVGGICPSSSWAQDKKSDDKSDKKEQTPITRLDEATGFMLEGLDDNQILQFRAIEQTYRTVKAVEDVQLSVTRAVDSCSKENPDIKDQMSDRLRSWKDALRPTMKLAYKKLDKMVLLQSFTQPSSVRRYLKMFDEAIFYRNQGIKEIPVTKKESCLKLKDNMDKTEKSLDKLLVETLGLETTLKTSEP
ncbi:MAG TPA: hypothetical protein PLE43_00790 [Alphaproteobacteria bacterium]|nr:hypothetical protein [Alphaproteobacteria bacterium]